MLLSLESGLCAPPSHAVYDVDPLMGNVLRVLVEGEGESATELVICESEWNGLVVADLRDDCDYCFLPTPRPHSP